MKKVLLVTASLIALGAAAPAVAADLAARPYTNAAGVLVGRDRIRQDVDLVTARLNYQFGGPIVAKY